MFDTKIQIFSQSPALKYHFKSNPTANSQHKSIHYPGYKPTYLQGNAPKIAKLVYDSNNYGLYQGDICIVNGVYKPTYIWGHFVISGLFLQELAEDMFRYPRCVTPFLVLRIVQSCYLS